MDTETAAGAQTDAGVLGEILMGVSGDRDPAVLIWVVPLLIATFVAIWLMKGRLFALIYVALIPFLNWTFSKGQMIEVDLTASLGGVFGSLGDAPVIFQPLTILTGLVFVVRDFVQREMGHRVLIVMAMAIGWSFFYAWPVIALASATAFAISEGVDWLLFTFTRYRLSTRILLSSALAAPVDTTVFLYGADLARQFNGEPAGTMLTAPNWVFFIIGKMVGAVIVSAVIRRREDRGEVDPAAA